MVTIDSFRCKICSSSAQQGIVVGRSGAGIVAVVAADPWPSSHSPFRPGRCNTSSDCSASAWDTPSNTRVPSSSSWIIVGSADCSDS